MVTAAPWSPSAWRSAAAAALGSLDARALDHALSIAGTNGTSRLTPFLRRLSNETDCCVHVIVIGGSIACGHGYPGNMGSPKAGNVKAAGGVSGAYAAHLHGLLNTARGACCAATHRVTNLCEGGKGTDYFLSSLSTRLVPVHREHPAHLVLVDTAPNDLNAFWIQRFGTRDRSTWLPRLHAVNALTTEALVRRLLLLRPRVAVAYVETAWYEAGPFHTRYGAWEDQQPVLRFYQVPTVHLGLVARAAGSAATGTRESDSNTTTTSELHARLSRRSLYVDAIHLSADGHRVLAHLISEALVREWERLSTASTSSAGGMEGSAGAAAAEEQDFTAASATLAPSADVAPYADVPLSVVDFTDMRGSWAGFVRKLPAAGGGGGGDGNGDGWQWAGASKQRNGSYVYTSMPLISDASSVAGPRGDQCGNRQYLTGLVMDRQYADHSGNRASYIRGTCKLAYVVRSGVESSFVARVSFASGRLRIGYLRSYTGQAAMKIEVLAMAEAAEAAAAPAEEEVLEQWRVNGTWDAVEGTQLPRVSIFATTDFRLRDNSLCMLKRLHYHHHHRGGQHLLAHEHDHAAAAAGEGGGVAIEAHIRFTSVPTPLMNRLNSSSAEMEAIEWAPFSLYTIVSY